MKTKDINIKKLEKIISKNSTRNYVDLIKWLYDNHKDVLREYESTKGNLRIEFAGKKEGEK